MLIVNIFFIYVTKITSSSRKEPLMITNQFKSSMLWQKCWVMKKVSEKG